MFLYFWALASPRLVEFPNINPWIFIKASQEQCLLQVMKNPISFGFDPFEVLLAPTGSLMEPFLISLRERVVMGGEVVKVLILLY
jgi:hypothetical protein